MNIIPQSYFTDNITLSEDYYSIYSNYFDPYDGIQLIRGCTNPRAVNYNYQATVDDGSCEILDYPIDPDDVLGGDGPIIPVAESKLFIKFTSDPINAAIIIDDTESGKFTSDSIVFDSRELINTKTFKIQKSGFESSIRYRVKSLFVEDGTGVYKTKYIIDKFDGSKWANQDVVVSSGGTSFTTLDFILNQNSTPIDVADPIIDQKYIVDFEVDVSSDNIVKYITSDQQSGFLADGDDPTITITNNVYGEIPWVQIERVGITKYTHNIKYSVQGPNTNTITNHTDDFRKELSFGTTKIKVEINKNNVTQSTTVPSVIVDNDNLEYNILSNEYIDIPYQTISSDKIIYTIGSRTREGAANGKIRLRNSDFTNGIGQYTLSIQPVSNTYGSGDIKRVLINVVSKQYLPGPDITKINYPYNIKGADFRGYDEDFKISWQSVNTNYIQVYVSKKSNEFALAKVASSGALTLNVADILRKAKKAFNDSTDHISFDLILIPYNTEGNSTVSGKEEKITITFDKSDIKLRRNQVLYDVRSAFSANFNEDIFKQQTSRFLTHLAHFGDGDNKLISTWGIDTETFSVYETDPETSQRTKIESNNSLVLKLYEPLPAVIQPNQQLWISKCQSLPVIEQIILTDDEVTSCILLNPNFDLDLGDDIGYQILDDLVASGSVSSTELIQQYIGNNEFSLAKLNLEFISGSDYTWDNFVKYSSADERVENFVYKIKLLEFYNASLDNLNEITASSISVSNEVDRTNEKISNVKKGFDSFENHLYTQSGSLTYPGAGYNEISSSTSSEFTSWYTGIIASAESFDRDNADALVNNIPQHFIKDDNGSDYILFFNMIGQHFDILWSYINKFSKSKQLQHTNTSGMTDDLIYHMLESLGWDADMGVRSQYLWEYAFGVRKDGTSTSAMTGKERQQEIWRRLLNNLPYLYKHKGTKRALTAAMACYGVPSSMLTIMEFGGPIDPTNSGTTSFTFDDRTSSINFDGTASILVPWLNDTGDYPQSIEIRVNTETKQSHKIMYGEEWELYVIPDTGSLAKIEFRITGSVPSTYESASTAPLPFFNDEYTQIVINKSSTGSLYQFDLYVKEGFNERIRNEATATAFIPNSSLAWDMGTDMTIGSGFTGTVDEFRLWKTALGEVRITNHALLPDAIDGNSVSASTEDLIYRMDFEYPKDRSATGDPYIKDVSINQSYGNGYATASNFTAITDYPYQYTPYERSVTAIVPSTGIFVSNKIRFESQTLDNYLNFGSISNATSFDRADDSNKLGLFFSPIKEVNMDIVRSLGQFNIDNYIGNPSDEYEDGYTELDSLRNYYFNRFNLNIYEYIQLVRYIDQTLFTTLRSLVPGRAKISTGLLIEPHILERSKIKRTKPIAESIGLESDTNIDDDINLESDFILHEASVDADEDISIEVDNPQYDGTLNAQTDINIISTVPLYNGNITLSDETSLTGSNLGIETEVDAIFTGSIQGQYYSDNLTSIGTDPNSIAVTGFGIWARDAHTIRTYIDKFGNYQHDRKKVYQLKEQYTILTPVNINASDSSLGSTFVTQSLFRHKVTFLDFDQQAPTASGNIVEVINVNGYLPSHYKYVGDLSTGMENSYYNGSKQTAATTLDGGSPVEIFTTNPNTLRVNESGRGSGEPILIVD